MTAGGKKPDEPIAPRKVGQAVPDAYGQIILRQAQPDLLTLAETKAAIDNDLILKEYRTVGTPTAEELKMTKGQAKSLVNIYYVKELSAGKP